MIYDFSDDSNLEINIKNDFKKKLISNENNFNEYISKFSKKYINNLDWWVSSASSRNNFTSDLYYNFTLIEFIKDEIDRKKNITKIIINSKIVKKIILNIISDKNLNIEVVLKYRKKLTIISFNFIIDYIKYLYIHLSKLLSSHQSKKIVKKKIYRKDNLTLIDTYLLVDFIDKDRYFNNLTKDIDEKKENIYFIPTIVTLNRNQIKNLKNIFIEIRKSKKNYLIKEDFISIIDLFYVFFHFIRIIALTKYRIKFNGVDYSKLVYNDLLSLNSYGMSIESLLYYQFIKKIKKNNYQIHNFINWWENQPIDKATNFALNKYYKDTSVLGYLGYVPRKLELNIYPCDEEIKAGVIPKMIGVIGKAYQKEITKFSKNLKTTVVPALRFEHLWKDLKKNYSNKYIFVPLPILINESLEILELILRSINNNKNSIKYLIKPHPAVSMDNYLKKFDFPTQVMFTNEPTDYLIHNTEIVLSGVSSICMESICLGIPTIIIEKNKCMIFDPIPSDMNNEFYKRINNHKDLTRFINYFLNINSISKNKIKLNYQNLKEYYFEKPNSNNKKIMLSKIY